MGIGAFFDAALEIGKDSIEGVSDFLDFGVTEVVRQSDREDTVRRTNTPEVDLREVERANPTNTNFVNPFGLPTPVIWVGAGLVTLIALKSFKVI